MEAEAEAASVKLEKITGGLNFYAYTKKSLMK